MTEMPRNSWDTSMILYFANDLLDSMNGSQQHAKKGTWRTLVTRKTGHVEFWTQSKKILGSMEFHDRTTGAKVNRPPSIRNCISTLNGSIDLWKRLQKECYTSFSPRHINQDPLENFFGEMRRKRHRNINPTCWQLKGTFSAAMICGLDSGHSLKGNCENDGSSILLNLAITLEESRDEKDDDCEDDDADPISARNDQLLSEEDMDSPSEMQRA